MSGTESAADATPRVTISHPAPAVAVVSLLGEHDLSSEPDVSATIVGLLENGSDVIVDLAETLFIDSKIISALGKASALAADHNRQLVLRLHSATVVRRALEITTVDQYLRHYETVEAAVAAIDAARA